MSKSKTKNGNARGHGNRPQPHGFNLRAYIREEWKATVFVAACVTIAHLGFNGLDAIDSYAFLAVGNRISHATIDAAAATDSASDSVVVVRIDEQTFRTRYRERSPLDRCVLSSQLSAIYAAQPHLVVVDLDLSPTDWSRYEQGPDAERERDCQAALEATLAKSVKEVHTVVMEPFDSFDPAVATRAAEWRQRQESIGIRFGDASLPVSYGITLEHFTGARTLYAAAKRASVAGDVADEAAPPSRATRRIDIHAYTEKLQPVLTSWTDTPLEGTPGYTDEDLTKTLRALLPAATADDARNRVVFFGAGYGQEDTFLTPLGKLYGVEVHAAAFLSGGPPGWSHVVALAIEIAIAFLFGMIIVYCWTQYFAWRCDERSIYAQLASIWVAIMLSGLLLALAFTVVISAWLLSTGMWLSPIPIAAGMLIESCMAGSIEAAVRRLHLVQSGFQPPVVAPGSLATLSTGFKTAVWGLALVGALGLAMFHH